MPKDIKDVHLTPTQTKLFNKLSDGEPHAREDLFPCLYDDFSEDLKGNLAYNIHLLRGKLNDCGMEITCRKIEETTCYQLAYFMPESNRI